MKPKNWWLEQTREIRKEEDVSYGELLADLNSHRMLAPTPDEAEPLDFAIEVVGRLANLEARP